MSGSDDNQFGSDDILDQIDWDNLFLDGCDLDTHFVSDASAAAENFPAPSPDSVTSWVGEIENILMKDDFEGDGCSEDLGIFLADVLVDTPESVSADQVRICSDHGSEKKKSEKMNDDGSATDYLNSKKLKRKLRNRDAAVRSRERKKMYVRDLELKSKYLEAECRRLGRMLQCTVAENQALRLSLQKGGRFGVTSAKQESAVLLLESLLLGSLLWLLGITMCLAPSTLVAEAVPKESEVEERVAKKVEPIGAGSEELHWFLNSRRCKASRTRMKLRWCVVAVV
ncbi:hypothetical protein K2173_027681 [Erythroxylum novogranatense]|uniref:BZIP domain-containing protein n=1 Tax=Erythroxylum novogranatense TaxID=1862640 RepID=A0AAV8U2K0_9ROSI|nr:hypothetical protein K2173_027681 [Erythroxylum novogranatense]